MLYRVTGEGFELVVMAGLTPAEAVGLATHGAADHLGMGAATGTVFLGKAADLVLIDSDPTDDIRAVREVRATIADGDVYFPTEIYEAVNITPFSPAPRTSGWPS